MLGERLRLLGLIAAALLRAGLAGLYRSRAWRFRFRGPEPARLLFAPQDLRADDPTRAAEILEGRFVLAGKSVQVRGMQVRAREGEARSPFELDPPSPAWNEALLGFTWLRHLRAAEGGPAHAAARALVGAYLRSGRRHSAAALDPATTARRVLAWLSQSPLVLEEADRGAYRRFLRSLAWQARYLGPAARVGPDGLPRLLGAMAVMQAALCLDWPEWARRRAAGALARELGRQVLPDGGHISRNPQATLEILLDLLPLRQSFAARDIEPPSALLTGIDRLMPMLRFYRHADGAFAAFNGMGYTQPHLVATLLAYDDARGQPVHNAPHAGYQRLDVGTAVLLADAGPPPHPAVSREAHAGPLSFEFSAGGQRLVVNCGAPGPGRPHWRQLARTTAAHSTAVVGEASCAVIMPEEGLTRLLARPLLFGAHRVALERHDGPEALSVTMSHDGYGRGFGLVHQRELTLARGTGALTGRDSFLGVTGAPYRGTAPVTLRFHLHPSVRPVLSADGAAVDLVLPGQGVSGQGMPGRWRFQAGGLPLGVEESIHFANPEGPRRSAQIVLTLPQGHADAVTSLAWSLVPQGEGALAQPGSGPAPDQPQDPP